MSRGERSAHKILLAPVLLGLIVYLVLFYASPMSVMQGRGGKAFSRGEFVATWLFLPDELAAQWTAPDGSMGMLDRLPVLLTAAGVLLGAAAAGWLVLVGFRLAGWMTRLEQVAFSAAVGLNLISTYVLAVGLLGGLKRAWLFWLPGVSVAAVAAWVLWRRLGRGGSTGRDDPPAEEKKKKPDDDAWLSPWWLVLAAVFVAVILLGGMLPPNEFDVREYHLQVPKEFYQAGRITFLPHNLYGNMALGSEMLSLLGMVLTGDWWLGALVGKTLIAMFAPLTALGLLAAGKRLFSTSAGVVAAIVYVSIPWVVQVSAVGFVEGVAGFYLFMAFYAVLLWQRAEGRPAAWIALAGYLAGAAFATKYPGALFVVLPLGAWVTASKGAELFFSPARGSSPPAKSRIGPLLAVPLVFAAAAAAAGGLWLVKNWLLAGNPTYPLLYEVFGGRTWTAEKNVYWNWVVRPHDFSALALGGDLARVLLGSDWLSPILVPLAALAFFRPGPRRYVLAAAGYFAFVIAAWWLLASRVDDRYWVPAMPLLAWMAGEGACWCRSVLWRRLLIGLLVAASVSNFLVATSGPGGYNRYFGSLRSLRVATDRLDPWHAYFNRHAGGTVLMVGEAQVFDLEVPILYNTWLDDSIFEHLVRDPRTGNLRSAEDIRGAFRARGISHVYVDWDEIERYRTTGYGNWDFIRPEVFTRLVAEGVLRPVAPTDALRHHPGRAYRVAGSTGA